MSVKRSFGSSTIIRAAVIASITALARNSDFGLIFNSAVFMSPVKEASSVAVLRGKLLFL